MKNGDYTSLLVYISILFIKFEWMSRVAMCGVDVHNDFILRLVVVEMELSRLAVVVDKMEELAKEPLFVSLIWLGWQMVELEWKIVTEFFTWITHTIHTQFCMWYDDVRTFSNFLFCPPLLLPFAQTYHFIFIIQTCHIIIISSYQRSFLSSFQFKRELCVWRYFVEERGNFITCYIILQIWFFFHIFVMPFIRFYTRHIFSICFAIIILVNAIRLHSASGRAAGLLYFIFLIHIMSHWGVGWMIDLNWVEMQ